MGGSASKKKQTTAASAPSQTQNKEPEQQNPQEVVQRPDGSEKNNAKLSSVDIVKDQNIDKEASNKKLVQQQVVHVSENVQKSDNLPQNLNSSFENKLEKLEFREDDLADLEKKMLEDDLSPINRSDVERDKEKDIEKIRQTQRMMKNTTSFKWEEKGSVKMISVQYKYVYSHKLQRLILEKPYDAYFNHDLHIYEMTLIDVDIYFIATGDIKKFEDNKIKFMVDFQGNYIGIMQEAEFLNQLKKTITLQKKAEKMDQIQKETFQNQNITETEKIAQERVKTKKLSQNINFDSVLKKTNDKLRQLWQQTVTQWLQQQDNEQDMVTGHTTHQGKQCLLVNKKSHQAKDKLEQFLRMKLEKPDYFDYCFNSNRTLRDALKKWSAFSVEEELAYLKEDRYPSQLNERDRIVISKLYRFPILEKYQDTHGIIDEVTLKPHVITIDNAKQIVIDLDRDLYVDIEHELQLIVFIWPNQIINKLQNENLFIDELENFRELCNRHLKQIIFELSMLPNYPMQYRPKFKDKYFQL